MLAPDSVPRRADSLAVVEARGSLYILPLGNPAVQGPVVINESGRAVWDQLDGERSIRDVATALARDVDADPALVFDEVYSFLQAMRAAGLIEESS